MQLNSTIIFGNSSLKKDYLELDSGKFQDKNLKQWLDKAFAELEKNAFAGIQIPKKLIPKEYEKKF